MMRSDHHRLDVAEWPKTILKRAMIATNAVNSFKLVDRSTALAESFVVVVMLGFFISVHRGVLNDFLVILDSESDGEGCRTQLV